MHNPWAAFRFLWRVGFTFAAGSLAEGIEPKGVQELFDKHFFHYNMKICDGQSM